MTAWWEKAKYWPTPLLNLSLFTSCSSDVFLIKLLTELFAASKHFGICSIKPQQILLWKLDLWISSSPLLHCEESRDAVFFSFFLAVCSWLLSNDWGENGSEEDSDSHLSGSTWLSVGLLCCCSSEGGGSGGGGGGSGGGGGGGGGPSERIDGEVDRGGSERKGGEESRLSSWTVGRETLSQPQASGGGAESSGRSEMQSVWTPAAWVLGCCPALLRGGWAWLRRNRLDFRVTWPG